MPKVPGEKATFNPTLPNNMKEEIKQSEFVKREIIMKNFHLEWRLGPSGLPTGEGKGPI